MTVAVVVTCFASSGHESESERSLSLMLSLCAGTDHESENESHAVGVTVRGIETDPY